MNVRTTSSALAVCAALAAFEAAAGKSSPAPAVEGPVDETVKETIKTLEASSVEQVPLDRYTLFGLDALADFDRCLGRRGEGASLVLSCGATTVTAPWPPASSDAVAQLLSDAMRLVDPERTVRGDRVKRVARALARAVDDPFTAYFPPEMVSYIRSPLFSATPGIEVNPRDPTKIREVRRGSDAARSEVQPGDRLVSINDEDAASMTYAEINTKLFGENDSVVRIKLKTAAGERTVRLARAIARETDVFTKELEGGVVYVHLPAFKAGVAKQVAARVWDARPRGVIIDLRHNGGGLVNEGIAIADLFLDGGRISALKGKGGRVREEWAASREAGDVPAPLVLLVDGATASASELLSLAMQENKRAKVLGSQTAGKGSVQVFIDLPDGGVLRVTTAYYVGPQGRRLPDTGIAPDRFLAPPSGRTVLEGGDPKKDSWVLSGLDELMSQPRRAHSGGSGPDP